MSKVDYNKFSHSAQPQVNTEPAKTVESEVKKPETEVQNAPEPPVTPVTPVGSDTVTEPEVTEEKTMVIGVVANCAKLNIRKAPSATSQVLCVVNVNDKVYVDLDNSTNAWYSVCTNDGIVGYCMKNYIAFNN